jgi:type II secretory pathway component HofQ
MVRIDPRQQRRRRGRSKPWLWASARAASIASLSHRELTLLAGHTFSQRKGAGDPPATAGGGVEQISNSHRLRPSASSTGLE